MPACPPLWPCILLRGFGPKVQPWLGSRFSPSCLGAAMERGEEGALEAGVEEGALKGQGEEGPALKEGGEEGAGLEEQGEEEAALEGGGEEGALRKGVLPGSVQLC